MKQQTTEKKVTLAAEPEELEIDIRRTGVVIVDMQHAFVSRGAFLDLRGSDTESARAAVTPIRELCRAARSAGCKVIHIYTVHHPEDAGSGPDSVFWHKENSLRLYRERPEYKEKLLLPGTWGAKIMDELAPEPGDALVEKPRYSGFYDTTLDNVLKRYNLKYLLMTGVATNICVEATIRDAFYRGYFPILVSDGTASSGPTFAREASLFNIKRAYGWVTTSTDVITVLK